MGHLDDIRTPIHLLEALEILKKNDSELSKKVQFEFYGDLSDKDKLFIINNESSSYKISKFIFIGNIFSKSI